MAKEQKEWWFGLVVTIIGGVAGYVAANRFPFRDSDKDSDKGSEK